MSAVVTGVVLHARRDVVIVEIDGGRTVVARRPRPLVGDTVSVLVDDVDATIGEIVTGPTEDGDG